MSFPADNEIGTSEDKPWREVPPEVAALLAQKIPEVAQELIEAVGVIPDYARPLEGEFGRNLRLGTVRTCEEFLSLIADGDHAEIDESPYRQLGEDEFHAGRSVDALQALFRLGGRIAFRRVSIAASAAGLSDDVARLLADALWAYVDRLSALASEGYRRGQANAAGSLAPARDRLFSVLAKEPFERVAFEEACAQARWQPPAAVAPVVMDIFELQPVLLRLDDSTLSGIVNGKGCVIMHDPDGPKRWELLGRALNEKHAAVGPTAPVAGLRGSLRLAERAWDLMRSGAVEPASPLKAIEALVPMLLIADQELSVELARFTLSPLASLKPSQHDRLADTLRSWLRFRGDRRAIAADLNIHVQTVAYRLRQLRQVFGGRLDDPEERFRLELALRAQSIIAR